MIRCEMLATFRNVAPIGSGGTDIRSRGAEHSDITRWLADLEVCERKLKTLEAHMNSCPLCGRFEPGKNGHDRPCDFADVLDALAGR